ncbi:MAG: hypothetical protein V1800_15775 [Candidatus Latescibacterota bacterium]
MSTQRSMPVRTAVRGLEDVVAAETGISYVDGINGALDYAG